MFKIFCFFFIIMWFVKRIFRGCNYSFIYMKDYIMFSFFGIKLDKKKYGES